MCNRTQAVLNSGHTLRGCEQGMTMLDMDPDSRRKLGRALIVVGIIAIVLGAGITAIFALSPTDEEQSTPEQNARYGLVFCLGPSLLAGIISIIAGRSMGRIDPREDIGSLYRGGR
jgi:drug/metabolite transporter (DMT)-like permease